ncbi:MAG: shikimate kinase [Lachnospiraceae bacterium]|nr:shikimate kinase [Lachnospiraceae bacterium]
MQTKNNIILIGMPASGKSTVGVILAKILGMDFIDTDILIQQREGARLNRIIEMSGIDEFLKKEEQALLSLDVSRTVIATGGSAVYSDVAMKHLADGFGVIYLKAQLEEIKKRLGDIKERGVVIKPGESLEEMYKTRAGLYEKYADITVDEDGRSIEDTVRRILDRLSAY